MIVTAYGEQYECTRAVKGPDAIELYNEDSLLVSFGGISDFSGYEIADGTWDSPSHATADERLSAAESTLQTHDAEIDEIVTGLEALANG